MVAAIGHRGAPRIAEIRENGGVVAQLRHPSGFDGLHVGERVTVGIAGRLDEPEDISRSLGCFDVPSDAVLVYRAFSRWGADFAERLQGDYTIFIWDHVEARLLLVRDRFGVEPLYYAVAGSTFLFASEIKAIFAARPELQNPLREELVADYVAGIHAAEPSQTIYQRVHRLPAASLAIVRSGKLAIRHYYNLDPSPRPFTKSAPEEFADRLTVAVRRRMRTSGSVGALLSGGLDSSSIASLAARETPPGQALQTFTAHYDCDPNSEDAYAAAVRQKAGLSNSFAISGSEAGALEHLPLTLREMDRPPYGPNNSLTRHVARSAAAVGTSQVVLCGHGGDEIVSAGSPFLRELAQQGRWLSLWNEIGDPRPLGRSRPELFAVLFFRNSRVGRKTARVARALRVGQLAPADPPWKQFVSASIAHSPDYQDRYERRRVLPISDQLPWSVRSHANTILDPWQVELLEGLDHCRSSSGLLFRYPFWDKDVIELAVSLPGEEKWSRGWPRVLLRRAMEGVLPAEVAWRNDKYDFAPHFSASLRRPGALAKISRALGEDADTISSFVNVDGARSLLHALERQESGMNSESLYYLWRLTVLSQWIAGRRT
jgi:asparagine synthase (glutamine-hydrolysing)